MQRLALLLAVVAALVGVWVMFASVGELAAPVGVTPTSEDRGDEAEMLTGGLAGEGRETDTTEAVPDRVEVETTAAPADRQLVRVLVTRKDTGEPVPGAEVRYFEYFSTNALSGAAAEEYESLSDDLERVTGHYGTKVVADGLGVAYLPVDKRIRTTGRHGELYGALDIWRSPDDDADTEHRLELERDLTFRVRVVDSRGEPASGVWVGLFPGWKEGPQGNQSMYSLGLSSPGGLVTVPHFQTALRRYRRAEPYPDEDLLRARIPGWVEGGEPIDAEDPPEEPVILQLPPTGSVVVYTTDPAGGPVPDEIVSMVYLGIGADEELLPAQVMRLPADRRWVSSEADDGGWRFDWVVLGQNYVAQARVGQEMLQEAIKGPIAEGQTIEVVLSGERPVYILKGRVVDDQRRPLGNTRVQLRHTINAAGRSSSRVITTAEDGSFMTDANIGTGSEHTVLTALTIEDRPRSTDSEHPARMFSMMGERALVPGENDLGDVVLSLGPLVVSGRVLVNGQIPEARPARLSVERLEATSSVNSSSEGWTSAPLIVRYPDADRFEVRGIVRPGRHRLQVSAEDLLPVESVEFTSGADDVLIELESGGSLRASVLVDDVLPVQSLWLRLVPTDGQATHVDAEYRQAPDLLSMFPQDFDRLIGAPKGLRDEAREFRWQSLRPGGYTLQVLPRGDRVPLVEIPDVEIVKGELNEDPRLEGIDLRGRVREIVVTVLGSNVEDPAPSLQAIHPERAVALVNDRTPGATLQSFPVSKDGVATIVTGEPFLDLLVVARGYAPVELSGVAADRTVTLESLPRIVLRIAAATDLQAGHTMRASVSMKNRQPDTRSFASPASSSTLDSRLRAPTTLQDVDANGEVALPVGGDGTHIVRVMVRNDETGRSIAVEDIEPAEIEVRTAMGRQVFEIRIPEEALRRAIEEAGRR